MNNHADFFWRLDEHRMIASIKEPKSIEIALELRHRLSGAFLLTGHIGVLKSYVELFQQHQLPIFLHLDKIGGLSTDAYGLNYLAKVIKPAGIISTKTSVIRAAKKTGMLTIQRFFLVDSEGLQNIASSLAQSPPDIVELMPARIPEMIAKVKEMTDLPIITGGLLYEPEQGQQCLDAGAAAISGSRAKIWRANYSIPVMS